MRIKKNPIWNGFRENNGERQGLRMAGRHVQVSFGRGGYIRSEGLDIYSQEFVPKQLQSAGCDL